MKPSLEELSETVRQRLQWVHFHPPYLSDAYINREQRLKEHNLKVCNGFKSWYEPQKNDLTRCGINKITAFEYYNNVFNVQHEN